jgi:hypothetical protein
MDGTKLGKDLENTDLYVARASMPNGVHCGKTRLDWDFANIPYGGKEVKFIFLFFNCKEKVYKFEVLKLLF